MRRRVTGASETLAVQVADAVARMRDSDVQKPPGIAEAIDWLAALEPARRGARSTPRRSTARSARCSSTSEDQEVDPRGRPRAARAQRCLRAARRSASRRSQLDLPPLAGRVRPAPARAPGVPVTPERSARLRARARRSCGRVARRRLYWTARAVFVSDPSQRRGVRRRVRARSSAACRRETAERDDAATTVRRAAATSATPERAAEGDAARRARAGAARGARRRRGRRRRAEVDVPLAMASDEERLPSKSFDALDADELAQLYRLMSQPGARHAAAAHPPPRARAPRRAHRRAPRRCARACAPAGDPIRLARRRRRVVPAAAGDAVRHLGLDGALRARVPAVPDLRRRRRSERRGVRLRHAADAPHARAAPRAAPSARSSAPPPPRPTGRAARGSATR